MKIVNLRFLNLNSLKGEHIIHFDQPPLSESGLFAITGPTGAGKTTILDAITLALYGEVPRHDKADPSEIMTRHTVESFAEVEFEVKGVLYRSKWSNYRAHKKASGKLQGVKMELANATTQEIIENTSLSRFHAKVVEICGLDYGQFLRSVILAQGDFTRFLKANENERSDLLEKITDTSIYSKISIFTYEKTREEKARLDLLNNRLKDVTLLPEEERTAYGTSIKELKTQEKENRQEEKKLQEKVDWINKMQVLELRRNELIKALQEEEKLYESNQDAFKKLQAHQQATAFKPALATIKTVEDLLIKAENDLGISQSALPLLQDAAIAAVEELTKKKTSIVQLRLELTEAEPLFEIIIQKDNGIENARQQLGRTKINYLQVAESLRTAQETGTKMGARLQEINKDIQGLQTWLKENEADRSLDKELVVFSNYAGALKELKTSLAAGTASLLQHQQQVEADKVVVDKGKQYIISVNAAIENIHQQSEDNRRGLEILLAEKTLNELENEWSLLPVLINTSEQQLRLADAIHLYKKESGDLEQRGQLSKTILQDEEEKLNLLKIEQEDASKKLEDLQQLYELEVKIQKYEADRQQLQPEQPCPLCGSIHHPYARDNYHGHAGEAELRRNQQKEILTQLTKQRGDKALEVNTLHLQFKADATKYGELQKLSALAMADFDNNNTQLPKALDAERPDIISLVIQKKQQEQKELKTRIAAIRDLQQAIAGNETLTAKQRELLLVARGKLKQADIRIGYSEKQIESIQNEMRHLRESEIHIVQEVTAMLKRFQLSYEENKLDEVAGLLNKRFENYALSENKHTALSLDQIKLETELHNIGQSLAEKNNALSALSTQQQSEAENLQKLTDERIELFGTRDPGEERKRLNKIIANAINLAENLQLEAQQKQAAVGLVEDRIRNGNKDLLNHRATLHTHTQALVKKLEQNDIASINVLQSLFMEEEAAKKIDWLQKQATQKIVSGKDQLSVIEKEWQLEKEKSSTTETINDLLPRIEMKTLALANLNQQIGKLTQILEADEQLKIKHRQVAEEIDLQQLSFQRWNKLSALIGSADGKKFSRFAQGLTLARLTDLANRHLLKLSDRYRIIKSKEKDLELQIIDGYQADAVRPMATLSGGESFLVSLALALGLSDLASRKVQINSLFIDEGFGTLDADTLDIAISALENLQAGGKSIGIISHVEALKERIGAQIQVTRQPGGYSSISVKGYGSDFTQL